MQLTINLNHDFDYDCLLTAASRLAAEGEKLRREFSPGTAMHAQGDIYATHATELLALRREIQKAIQGRYLSPDSPLNNTQPSNARIVSEMEAVGTCRKCGSVEAGPAACCKQCGDVLKVHFRNKSTT